MKEACEGAYRERAGQCQIKCFLTCKLTLACATVHSVVIYMTVITLSSFPVVCLPPRLLSIAHIFSVILPQEQISCWPRLQTAGAGLSGPGIDRAPSRGLPFISEP